MNRFNKTSLLRISVLLAALLLCAALESCSTSMPKIDDVIVKSSEKRMYPDIVGAHGPLPPAKAKALFQKLEKQAYWTDILQRQIFLTECISDSNLTAGNKATLLVNEQTAYAAMREAIGKAKHHVNFETYIFAADKTGKEMADLLLSKQAEGVEVNLIYDAVGCLDTPADFFERLRAGGVNILPFRPLDPLAETARTRSLIQRDHRKILIVDGEVAVTGGINIGSSFSESMQGEFPSLSSEESWRDTDVLIEGPVVADFQKLFLETWENENGPKIDKSTFFPPLKKAGNQLIQVVGSSPEHYAPTIYLLYMGSIRFADTYIHLTNAYFVPTEDLAEELSNAAKRGVDVKLILPSASDHSLVLSAGRSYYTDLLKSGVRIFERQNRLLHAKTAVIDGVWSTVGSTNMDLWSFKRNNEVNAIILGREFAKQMEQMFEDDLKQANEVKLEQWEKRPLSDRLFQLLGRMFSHWL